MDFSFLSDFFCVAGDSEKYFPSSIFALMTSMSENLVVINRPDYSLFA
jgi:hypothetical protein